MQIETHREFYEAQSTIRAMRHELLAIREHDVSRRNSLLGAIDTAEEACYQYQMTFKEGFSYQEVNGKEGQSPFNQE